MDPMLRPRQEGGFSGPHVRDAGATRSEDLVSESPFGAQPPMDQSYLSWTKFMKK